MWKRESGIVIGCGVDEARIVLFLADMQEESSEGGGGIFLDGGGLGK